jgi:molybdopterin-guanine dinucleotide biosynthesis protein A
MSADAALLGVVLAGGLSSRMGRDKAMLDFRGLSLLRHQVDLLAPLCSRVIVSGDYAGFDCIADEGDRCGPLGGLYAVSRHIPGAALLVIPVDMPELNHAVLARLLENRAACHFEGQPLPAFFPDASQVATAIRRMFAEPERGLSLRRLHQHLASGSLIRSGFEPFNINTPADWLSFTQKYT